MPERDATSKYFYLQNNRVFYFLLSGLTYTEIANIYYFRQKYKFVYEVRKLARELQLTSRGQLVNFALVHKLINPEKLATYTKRAS